MDGLWSSLVPASTGLLGSFHLLFPPKLTCLTGDYKRYISLHVISVHPKHRPPPSMQPGFYRSSSELIALVEDEDCYRITDPEAEKDRIREIIAHQRSLFLSSSSSSSLSSFGSSGTLSSFNSSCGSSSSSLLELMKAGGKSLGGLFEMENSNDYSDDKPFTQPLLAYNSDSDDSLFDLPSWSPVKPFRISHEDCGSDSPVDFPLEYSITDGRLALPEMQLRSRMLATQSSFTNRLVTQGSFKNILPTRLVMWRCSGFRLRLRLRLRLRQLKRIVCRRVRVQLRRRRRY